MFKEIIEDILQAEKEADTIERDAAKQAQAILLNAHNKADEMNEAAEKDIKAAVKKIMVKASSEGEAKAVEAINAGREQHSKIYKAAEKNSQEAAGYIIREFLSSNNI